METGIKESVFNEAALKMQRIDSLQRNINLCLSMPLVKHEDGSWAYEIALNTVCSLISEVWPKLTDKEKDEMREEMQEGRDFLDFNLLMDRKTKDNWRSSYLQPNENFKTFINGLRELDLRVRELLDIHKLGSPDQRDLTKSMVEM